ncbi:CACTA en-spm transposon protein [Cucumis melo var. makuwa]|uniref:CACTA en-spm transposon protein n=2 Tax=Cucumis melo TaxID=3656 RepID=A0A5D3BPE4_CUCMM|nr:CACTA en-spm transposon protein [Cucumis melo var. makuwa]
MFQFCETQNKNKRGEREIVLRNEEKRKKDHCRHLEPAVMPLSLSATAHPYLRGGSRIACKEEEMEEGHLEDEMSRNIGVDIDEDTTKIFQDLLDEARNELYPGCSEFSSLNFLVKLIHVKEGSTDMTWHRDKHVETDDEKGWKHFDYEFPDFASDPQNMRLGLASDGFNSFGHISTSYSTMSSFPSGFDEIDAMSLEFAEELDNCAGGYFSTICDSDFYETCIVSTLRVGALRREYIEVVKGDLQEQSRTNKDARQQKPYNHSNGLKSFLQRQHELVEQREESIDHVELFQQTHIRDKTPSLPQTVLNHSLGTRYVRRCWIDDRATQKALVGDLSPRLIRRPIRPTSCSGLSLKNNNTIFTVVVPLSNPHNFVLLSPSAVPLSQTLSPTIFRPLSLSQLNAPLAPSFSESVLTFSFHDFTTASPPQTPFTSFHNVLEVGIGIESLSDASATVIMSD